MPKHFLTILDIPRDEAKQVLLRAKEMKDNKVRTDLLAGKTLLLIFEKASTRTRVSFEVGVRQLGGDPVFIASKDSQLGRSEPLKDTARVLTRYADGLIVRTFGQEKLETLVEYGDIPVVNALTDEYHPCQIMADVLTMYERTPNLEDLKVAWVGDGNNMAHSFINGAAAFGYELTLACPKGYEPDQAILDKAVDLGAKVTLTRDPAVAVSGAHYVNTDVWASMGQEEEQKKREAAFAGFEVNDSLMGKAAADAKFMHCLPVHRGEEVSEAVFESPASIVWDQAENRLHMQKAILEWIYK
ncbi:MULTISPECIES: ornithine carbamoyltransferase [unclassified Pseudodesulfovibrio]|uniref:ornithine carbamoyltransferase n=1 Tax=unclassified Pseudodesulfovibrio TaxID=2661612 RepID=UPI000FEBA979|nr:MULTISPECIES: ornithine carbamoyltransferase [unclassified Pseudodesulfovibrio]MCJ2164256.1 ornithine carbamoyltransferase [Pseudodesulfovibrio sp. S3-i]RWU05121.1 ornithine carbamoyltransferase [Pseudodesulfovibrio sp. S3]